MLEAGFLNEVRVLREKSGVNAESASMRSVGYRQAWKHLEYGTKTDEFVEEALAATRQLAKKQMTWLRSWEDAEFFSLSGETKLIERALEAV